MCYSIMVETSLEKLAREFSVSIDYPSFRELYEARNKGRSQLKIPSALDLNFKDADTQEAAGIRTLIAKYQCRESERLQQKIAAKQELITTLTLEQKSKPTKTRESKLAVAQRALSKLEADLAHLSKGPSKSDARIFMYSYAPGVISQKGQEQRIVPLRYQLRPAGTSQEIPSNINCFNARVDKLEERYNWQRLFMNKHAAVAIKSFYEWVPDPEDKKKSKQVEFYPRESKTLWVPALWDEWVAPGNAYRIRSFAILTQDPPAEIREVGHDRCPVFPKQEFIDAWLHPEQHSKDYYYQMFNSLEPVYFEHRF